MVVDDTSSILQAKYPSDQKSFFFQYCLDRKLEYFCQRFFKYHDLIRPMNRKDFKRKFSWKPDFNFVLMDESTSDIAKYLSNGTVLLYKEWNGLYLVRGSVSACLAKKNGFTEEDLDKLFEAIIQMYNHDISSSKQGMSVVGPLIIFKHVGTQAPENREQNEREAMLGCAPAHKLFELLTVKKKEDVLFPRRYDDYEVSLNVSSVPNGVRVGFKSYPFEPVEWYDADHMAQYENLDISLR